MADVDEATFTPHPYGGEVDEDVFEFDAEGKLWIIMIKHAIFHVVLQPLKTTSYFVSVC